MRVRQALRAAGDAIVLGVRHSQVSLLRAPDPSRPPVTVHTVEPTGDLTYVHVRLGQQLIAASADADFRAKPDDPIWIEFDQNHLHLFDVTTSAALAYPSEAATSPAPVLAQ